MSLSRFLLPALATSSLFAVACTSEDTTPDELASVDADQGNVGKADAVDNTYTFFTVERDMRKCAAPMCGGYWVSRVNRDTTRCADGTYAAACYVHALDLSGLGVSDSDLGKIQDTAQVGNERLLLRGWVDKTFVLERSVGVFTASEAWLGGTDSTPDGVFVEIHDNGIRCIQAPCPSTSEYKLNSSLTAQIAGVDFSDSGATDRQISAALDQVGTYGVIVAGHRYTIHQNGHTAKGRTASQYWTRVPPQ